MKRLFELYPNLVITMAAAVIAFTVVFHVLFYLIMPRYSPALSADHILMPPLASGQPTEPILIQSSYFGWLAAAAGLLIVVLLGVIGLSLFGHYRSQKLQRDGQRRRDLEQIKKGFLDYRRIHGHFPISSTYQAEYYTGVNLSKDWNYYGLPNTEQMQRVLSNWPISDPQIDYHADNQVNQYLYYPRENGQAFDLYAHLELPPTPLLDYNALDNLLRSWGSYNYKTSSTDEALPIGPAVAEQNQLLAQEQEIKTAILNQTAATDAGEINAELNFLADEVVANPKPSLPDTVISPSMAVANSTGEQLTNLYQAVEAKQARQQEAPITPQIVANPETAESVPPASEIPVASILPEDQG